MQRTFSLQVREALMTSALLQLPMSMGRRAKVERVNAVLEELVSCKRCKTVKAVLHLQPPVTPPGARQGMLRSASVMVRLCKPSCACKLLLYLGSDNAQREGSASSLVDSIAEAVSS